MKHRAVFATDLDGTLATGDQGFNQEDLRSLELLRENSCCVILASGRSPFSLWRCLGDRQLPVDWYVLSSGAGILDRHRNVQLSHSLSPAETKSIHHAFTQLGVKDVSIQGRFPDAHLLHWIPGDHCDDFLTRLELYRGYARETITAEIHSSEVIGFVEPDKADNIISALKTEIGHRFSIIRATSPIDHETVWVEVFPRNVHKGASCEHVRSLLDVPADKTAAVGNDWNDLHMLEWAACSFAVENAPVEIRNRFTTVPSNNNGGVSTAASMWLEMIQ